jgi:hypothetical protein
VQLVGESLQAVMDISIQSNTPMWKVVSDLVDEGLKVQRPKRKKINKYQHFSRAKRTNP